MKSIEPQVKENENNLMKGESKGNEEPVEERSDKIYDQSDKTKKKPGAEIDMPSPEPGKTDKKIPNLRNSL